MLQSLKAKQLLDSLEDWFFNSNREQSLRNVYANVLGKYDEIETYRKIYDKNISRRKMPTSVSMEYSNQIQFGESMKNVKNIMPGRRIQVLNSSNGIKRTVMLYHLVLNDQKVVVEFHFHKNELFYYKFTFDQLETQQSEAIISALLEKYFLPTINVSNYSIFDTDNNCILVDEDNELSISYTQMENPFFSLIEEQYVVKPAFSTI